MAENHVFVSIFLDREMCGREVYVHDGGGLRLLFFVCNGVGVAVIQPSFEQHEM